MTAKRVKSQYWDFVHNNETDESSQSLISVLTQWDEILDAGFQHEIAPTTGTKHLQGWIKLRTRQYKSYLLRSRLNMGDWTDKISFRPARNPKALVNYCQKSEGRDYWCKSESEAESVRLEQQKKGESRRRLRNWRNHIETVHSEHCKICDPHKSDESDESDESGYETDEN